MYVASVYCSMPQLHFGLWIRGAVRLRLRQRLCGEQCTWAALAELEGSIASLQQISFTLMHHYLYYLMQMQIIAPS